MARAVLFRDLRLTVKPLAAFHVSADEVERFVVPGEQQPVRAVHVLDPGVGVGEEVLGLESLGPFAVGATA